jgi:hypothetical protein
MASGIWVAGPAELWVGVGAGGSLAFLGWSTPEGFRGRITPMATPVRCDLAGDMPLDMQFMGETIHLFGDLAVWDEAVLRACQTRGNPFGGIAGRMEAGAVGALMRLEGKAYRTLLYPPYTASKPTQAGQTVFNVVSSWLRGPDEIGPIGTHHKLVRVFIEGLPVYNPADGSFTTYDSNVAGKGIAS